MNENTTSMLQGVPLNYYIWLSTALFVIGVMGVLYRRNAIIIFMCIELMLNAVNILLVAFLRISWRRYRADLCILYYGCRCC